MLQCLGPYLGDFLCVCVCVYIHANKSDHDPKDTSSNSQFSERHSQGEMKLPLQSDRNLGLREAERGP